MQSSKLNQSHCFALVFVYLMCVQCIVAVVHYYMEPSTFYSGPSRCIQRSCILASTKVAALGPHLLIEAHEVAFLVNPKSNMQFPKDKLSSGYHNVRYSHNECKADDSGLDRNF